MCCAQDSISVTMQVYCMCMCCMCDKYMVSGCVHNNVCAHKCVHSCTCTLCENSVKMRTQSGTSPVCVCVCVGGGVQAMYITMQGVLLHMYVLCE